MIGSIARREALALFHSPLAWVLLATLQATVAFLFLLHLESYMEFQDQLRQRHDAPGVTGYLIPRIFSAAAVIFLLVIPLLTMNLIAGERRQETLPLLLSAPVSSAEIILGKFAGLVTMLLVLAGLFTAMPASLGLVASVDAGTLLLAWFGMSLFMLTVAAIGMYLSTLAPQPALAAISTLGVLLVLLLAAEWGATLAEPWATIVSWPAPTTHLEPFLRGLFDTGAAMHFVILTGVSLALAIRRLDNERLQH